MEDLLYKASSAAGNQIEIKNFDGVDFQKLQDGTIRIRYQNKQFIAEVLEQDPKSKEYLIRLNNRRIRVSLESPLDLKIKEMGMSLKKSRALDELAAPMPGLVLDILVEVGSEVEEGTPILVLEAMKMENVLKAASAQVVKSIETSTGKTVNKGDVLVRFE